MGNNNSLIPLKMETAINCTQNVVWYNSVKGWMQPNIFTEHAVELDQESGLYNISFASQSNFKVLIYTAVTFDQTQAAGKIRDHYDGELRQEEQSLASLLSQKQKAENDLRQMEQQATD